MVNRPKKYGGTSRGNDREREEQGRSSPSEPSHEPRRARPKRASESDIWERESPSPEDSDTDELDEFDEQEEQD